MKWTDLTGNEKWFSGVGVALIVISALSGIVEAVLAFVTGQGTDEWGYIVGMIMGLLLLWMGLTAGALRRLNSRVEALEA